MATRRGSLQSRIRTACGCSFLASALLVLCATPAIAAELRTRLATSDGDRTIFAVRCPSGHSTQVVIKPGDDGDPQLCYSRLGQQSCESDLTVAEGAAKACGVPADGDGDSGTGGSN